MMKQLKQVSNWAVATFTPTAVSIARSMQPN